MAAVTDADGADARPAEEVFQSPFVGSSDGAAVREAEDEVVILPSRAGGETFGCCAVQRSRRTDRSCGRHRRVSFDLPCGGGR